MVHKRSRQSHLGTSLVDLPKFLPLNDAILFILGTARQRIHTVADRLRRGLLGTETILQATIEMPQRVHLPENEEWDFALGDTVRIRAARDDFKWIQKETHKWDEAMNDLLGRVGVIVQVQSKYQNGVAVYFPDDHVTCEIYTDLLEKVPVSEYPDFRARWKPGDRVKTLSCNELFSKIDKHFSPLELGVMGKPGRVIAVDYRFAFVTYDDLTAFAFESYWLVPCDDSRPIKRKNKVHGFEVGEKVKVTSNMKKLIENQKKICGWKEETSSLLGAVVTVVGFYKNSICVQAKHSRRHTISQESLLQLDEKEEKMEDDLEFVFGDTVTLVLPKSILGDLAFISSVPSEFLKYLKTPAVVSHVTEDFEYLVEFGKSAAVYAHKQIISKPTKSDQRHCAKIKQLTEKLYAGDRVHLDVGPPSFVRVVIKDLQYSPKIKMALTESAVLEGYLGPYYVIIKYDDGTRFRIERECLTVPDKFFIKQEKMQRKSSRPSSSSSKPTSRRSDPQKKRRVKK